MNAKAEEMEEKAGAEAVERDFRKDPRCPFGLLYDNPYEWIKIKGGKYAANIRAEFIKYRLVDLAGDNFSFEIVGHWDEILPVTRWNKSKNENETVELPHVTVHGRLTINGAVHEDFASHPKEGEFTWQAAQGKVMCGCAKDAGIGWEVDFMPKMPSKPSGLPRYDGEGPIKGEWPSSIPSSGPTHAVSGGKADAKAPAASEDMLAELETTKALLRDKVGKNAAMAYKAVVQKVRPADPKNPTDQEIEAIVQALHDGPLKSDADSGADPF